MPHAKKSENSLEKVFDGISGALFLLGIFVYKLCLLPNSLVSMVAYLVSLSLYLLGYLFWLLASHFYPSHPRLNNCWYGFSQFREQTKASASIGTIAVILSFLSFLMPVILIPSLWLFFISNLIWSVSHYHKLKNPHFSKEISTESQQSFLNYTLVTTSLSVVTATCITTALLVPPLAPLLLCISTGFGIALTVIATGYFLHYYLLSSKLIKNWKGRDYSQISANLLPENNENNRDPKPVPRLEKQDEKVSASKPIMQKEQKKGEKRPPFASIEGIDNDQLSGYNPR